MLSSRTVLFDTFDYMSLLLTVLLKPYLHRYEETILPHVGLGKVDGQWVIPNAQLNK